jgi:hypothetical protein
MIVGERPDANPKLKGVHLGLIGALDASLVLTASAEGRSSILDFTYANQSTAQTLRISVNHTLGRAQFFMGPDVSGSTLTQAINITRAGVNIGQSLTAESALQVTEAHITTVPTISGVSMGMRDTTPVIVLNAPSTAVNPYIQWTSVGTAYPATIQYASLAISR